jgi:6-phosphogluconolactonase (cycloisomerase 2 family)
MRKINVKTLVNGTRSGLMVSALLALSACGGGGGGGSAAPATYSVSATVSGLAGSGLVLQDNAANNLAVSGNGTVSFTSALTAGTTYAVTVATQPSSPTQTCTVTGGSGTVSAAVSVTVACVTNTYAVNAAVSGLAGSGLVLQDNLANNLSVTTSGTSAFATQVASGAAYSVTVLTQPSKPTQNCAVTGGSGTVGAGAVTATVVCTTSTFAISGTVLGLAGTGLVLQNNGANSLPISTSSDSFTFPTPVASGGAYNVTVAAMPTTPPQTCTVSNGSGTVGSGPVTTVVVTCSVNTYTLGGTVTGLSGTGLVLHSDAGNGAQNLTVSANGSFTFVTALASGSPYAVSVNTQPNTPNQYCDVTNPTGSIVATNVTNVSVTCRTTGRVAYVANHLTDGVAVYTINPTTGALTAVAGSPFAAGSGPISIAVTPNAEFAYVANSDDNTVWAYSINATTSALTPLTGNPFPVGMNPQSLTVDPTGKFLYVANFTDNTVGCYTINAITGIPTGIGAAVATGGTGPQNVTVDPTGTYLYVLDYTSSDMAVFTINSTTGVLTPLAGSPFAGLSVGSGPFYLAITPNDQYGYVENNDGSDHIIGFSISAGAPTVLANSPYLQASAPLAAAVDATGQFLYAINPNNSVTGYTINNATGDLTAMTTSTFPTDTDPRGIAIDPSGQFVYVVNGTASDISAYTIIPTSGGTLTNVTGAPFTTGTGSGPASVAISK